MALNDEQVQKVRQVLVTGGWREVMRPAIENRGRQAVRALTLSPTERAAEFKGSDFDTEDNVLRAIIRDCTWLAMCWDNEILVHDHNRQADELDRQNQETTAANPR